MRLQQYGISLNRLREEDIEMVRQWRNSQNIRNNMVFREYISPEQQKEWFRIIDNYDNFYYIIEYQGEKIGLIDNKNTNWATGSTDSGLFIYNEKYINTFVPVAASFILINVGFYILNGKDALIKILNKNKKAIEYNESLGFYQVESPEGKDDGQVCWYRLSPESFEKKTKHLRDALIQSHGNNDPYLYLVLEPHDYKNGVGQEVEKVLHALPTGLIRNITEYPEQKVVCFDLKR